MTHPIGRFTISRRSLREWRELLPLFSQMVPVQIEYRYDLDCCIITAYSDLFEPIEEHTSAPWYTFEFQRTLQGEIMVQCTKGKEPPL